MGQTHEIVIAAKNETRTRSNGLTLLDEDRSLDFHRGNFPNFATELGYRFGIDSKASETMKEFFETNRDNNTRRSFHIVSRLTIGAGRVEHVHAASAEVEPVSSASLEMVRI